MIATYFIISLEQEKRQLVKDGKIIESKLLSEKEIIDKEHEKLNQRSNSLSNEEQELKQKELNQRLKKALSDYPPFYHTQNKVNTLLVYQLVILVILIGYPFVEKQKKKIE